MRLSAVCLPMVDFAEKVGADGVQDLAVGANIDVRFSGYGATVRCTTVRACFVLFSRIRGRPTLGTEH